MPEQGTADLSKVCFSESGTGVYLSLGPGYTSTSRPWYGMMRTGSKTLFLPGRIWRYPDDAVDATYQVRLQLAAVYLPCVTISAMHTIRSSAYGLHHVESNARDRARFVREATRIYVARFDAPSLTRER